MAADQDVSASISFTFPLDDLFQFLVQAHVVERDTEPTDACPGNFVVPAAEQGHLCIYTETADNAKTVRIESDAYGAQVFVTAQQTGDVSALGTWAVTAP